MNKININPKYYFENETAFKNRSDNVHFFVMTDYSIGMHKQEFFEINIVIKGKGIHYIDGNEVDAEVGDVFIIPPEVEHGYIGGKGFDVYHIIVNNRFMQKNLVDLQLIKGFSILFSVEPMLRAKMSRSLHLKLSDSQLKSIESILIDRKEQIRFVSHEDAVINTGSFLIIITKLCGIYAENSSSQKETDEVNDAAFMRSLALIHERYNEKLTLDQLAAEANLSKSTYMRRFAYICKTSPAEYITRKRVDIAENLLRSTDASLMDIAEKVGFYDTAHFSRTFKKMRGISPSRYRAENKF